MHHVLLSRPLIYTAITRARRLVVIIGDDAGIERAVRNAEQQLSYTRLAERLRDDRVNDHLESAAITPS
jgi:exodeoxyribonuclease V alpha subunit